MKKMLAILTAALLTLGMAGTALAASTITVVSREAGSGTRSAFVELTGVETRDADGNKVDRTCEDAIIQNGTAQVMATVQGDVNAIGYISLGSLNDTVKAVRVAGVAATAENVAEGTYGLARPFNLAVAGEMNSTVRDFIGWMLSAEGQQIAMDNGYVAGEPQDYSAAPMAGKIVVGGSSSVSPLMEKLAEAYHAINPQVEIEVQTSDSTTGVTSALNGVYDIGMASRALKDAEKEAGLTEITLCMDGIAVIVNPERVVEELSVEQIRQIFTGEVTDWEAVR